MELITILNRCHRFRGFVYEHARFSADKKSIEVAVHRARVPPHSERPLSDITLLHGTYCRGPAKNPCESQFGTTESAQRRRDFSLPGTASRCG
jgi:hypothetical protein